MKKTSIPMSVFDASNICVEQDKEGYILTVPPEGGRLIIHGAPMTVGGVEWQGMKYLNLDVTALEGFDQTFVFVFMTPEQMEGPHCIMNVGILPQARMTVPIKLSYLDSQIMFPPRTPGRLKLMMLGRGIRIEEACVMVMSFKQTNYTQKIRIHDLYLSDEQPECKLDTAPIVDELGQFKNRQWKNKTQSVEELKEYLNREYEWAKSVVDESIPGRSSYGGDLSGRYEATGYFRTHFDGKRWFLVDPDGYRFLSTGLDCCIVGDDGNITDLECLLDETPKGGVFRPAYETDIINDGMKSSINHNKLNWMRTFGEDYWNKWATVTKARIKKWGFTTLGNWSDPDFDRTAHIPYVWPMDAFGAFPTTDKLIFRDFPDVFDPQYETMAAEFAKQLEQFEGDRYLIGYFMRNEPQWAFVQGLLIADKVLENPTDTCCKQEFIKYLKNKYITVDALNQAWNKDYDSFDNLMEIQQPVSGFSEAAKEDSREFSKIMIKRFVSIPAQACKKVDSVHLNLGMRYAQLTDDILLEGYENFDVFSINGYDADMYPLIQRAGEFAKMPVMVGEFHFGSNESGMLCAAICSVATQKDRGMGYRYYYEKAMDSPYFVGAHYFSLNDQPVLGRFDGENMNIGLVDVCARPYDDAVEEITRVNMEIYDLADGKRTEGGVEVDRVPRMMGF